MLNAEIQFDIFSRRLKSFNDGLKQLEAQCDAVRKVEAQGFELVKNRWDLGSEYTVTKEQLPKLRKIVGRLRVEGRYPAGDFDRTNQLIVYIRPMNEEFSCLSFAYRVNFRAGGKCRVVENTSSYKSLVCER